MAEGQTFDKAAADRAASGKPSAISVIVNAFAMKPQPYVTPWLQPDGTPLVLYFTPQTLADNDVIRTLSGDKDIKGYDFELALLVSKARHEDGTLAFAPSDAAVIKSNARAGDVRELLTFMYTVGTVTHSEAKDELGKTPSSAGS
jgi:hypothetical protein